MISTLWHLPTSIMTMSLGRQNIFYLEHAEKYQVKGRPRIGELWVPAAALVEEGLEGDARIIRSEARHRFKAKNGIRVFSRPDRLKEWMAARKTRLRRAQASDH